MARSQASLEDMYANLVIKEEEEDEIVVANNEVVEQKPTYMLVGKFLTEKNINFQAMQNLMASLWRPREGMEVYEMGDRKYSFIFYHKLDVAKVMEGGPWSFEQSMLVLHQVEMGDDPTAVEIQDMEMWIRIYDMPRGFVSENILKNIGAAMGKYVKSDPTTFEGGWKPYIRIRVAVNVKRPLKRRLKIKREGNNWSWINFKYEKLGTFCFVCGIIGHSERECDVVYANPEKLIDKAYGTWLRAPSRGAKNNTGSRWIRNTDGGKDAWGTQKQQGEASNVHGGNQGGARFMDVDGRIHEIGGEVGEILVKSRDLREQQVTENVTQGYKESNDENIVIDPKRKRVDNGKHGENNGPDLLQINENQPKDVSKNLLMAGPGVEKVRKKLNFAGCFAIDVQGHGGGLALIWKNEGAVQIINSCNNFIDFEVNNEQTGRWRYTGYYGIPDRTRRVESWNMLRDLSVASVLPWCIIGDFNDIVSMDEKRGGQRQPRRLMEGFSEAIMDCGLHDLGFSGDIFTWERSRGKETWIQERLDRGMATSRWTEMFPLAEVKILEVTTSDHMPILLQLNRQVFVQRGRRFKFENMWIKDRECRNIVQACWEEEDGGDLMGKIMRCCTKLEEWGGGLIHEMKLNMGKYRKEMQRYRSRRDIFGIQKYDTARCHYLKLLEKQEIFWRQRAKQFWLREGEKNTRFFHKFASTRKEHNKIKKLKNENGDWKETDAEIQEIITDYFDNMFCSTSTGISLPARIELPVVSDMQSQLLVSPIVEEEVKRAVFAMHSDKSPGIDGLNPGFYRAYWEIVGGDVTKFCRTFFETGELPADVNRTLVCLIPKVKQPNKVADLRPISLCNVLMRILSKVMANRLKPTLNALISEKQSAFIEGRLLTDNALIAYEINHYIHRKTQGKVGVAGLKVDISKAYDRLEWSFIEMMLERFAFPAIWIKRVMQCIKTVSYSFLRNGEIFGEVIPQ
ncbi:uncharacterized protein LOC141659900 [Apium graveolens]|uniref:uncharacterized protein LOC141659900 n=2 Tax=Apium graveolens TaxID=4045 RepID=UPI003D7A2CD6